MLALGREEVTRFVGTVFAFVRWPRQFGADWFAGRQRALNPLGCVATALAVTGFVGVFLPDAAGYGSPSTLLSQLGAAILPYIYYAAVGVAQLSAVANIRIAPSVERVDCGIALFTGGGPGFLVTLALQLSTTGASGPLGHRRNCSAIFLYGRLPSGRPVSQFRSSAFW